MFGYGVIMLSHLGAIGATLFFSPNVLSSSSIEKDVKAMSKGNKTDISKIVAEKLAKKAVEKKITKIYFDRGVYKYHGRVKAFAETLRKNGMEF